MCTYTVTFHFCAGANVIKLTKLAAKLAKVRYCLTLASYSMANYNKGQHLD